MKNKTLTRNQLRRLPDYLNLLKNLAGEGVKYISCQTIADCLNLNQEQVRKDIALISTIDGIPNRGRDINLLIKDIETILGYDDTHNAILVGVGNLGSALLNFNGFEQYGLKIVAAFDGNSNVIGKRMNNIPVYSITKIEDILPNVKARIGIITVPVGAAQEVANILMDNGIEAIWNFAPTNIIVREGVIISSMNMATSLAVLSHQLFLKQNKTRK
ncbi:MAG: redox-sensing transcriptional repressor Rex [Bacilli bacterium]